MSNGDKSFRQKKTFFHHFFFRYLVCLFFFLVFFNFFLLVERVGRPGSGCGPHDALRGRNEEWSCGPRNRSMPSKSRFSLFIHSLYQPSIKEKSEWLCRTGFLTGPARFFFSLFFFSNFFSYLVECQLCADFERNTASERVECVALSIVCRLCCRFFLFCFFLFDFMKKKINWWIQSLVLLGFTGFYWVLLGFTGFCWFFLSYTGFTGFYSILLGFTGFYWVFLSYTGLYWVLLGFT